MLADLERTTKFFVPCEPLPYCRARATVQHGYVRMYNKPEYATIKRIISVAGMNAIMDETAIPNLLPVELELTVILQRPKKLTGKYRKCIAVGKGDADNFLKPVFDALEGIYYYNDGQIQYCSCRKIYTSEEFPEPGFLIKIKNSIE